LSRAPPDDSVKSSRGEGFALGVAPSLQPLLPGEGLVDPLELPGPEELHRTPLLATGYTLDYPFVDRAALNWTGMAPKLYVNIFPPSFNGLYVMGMIEASGIGWQGRYEQAELIATYLTADAAAQAAFRRRVADEPWPDLTGGYRYLGLARMSYYVNKDAYRGAVRKARTSLGAQR
jgi:hypothetical protein